MISYVKKYSLEEAKQMSDNMDIKYDVIKDVHLEIIGHFGNCICLNIIVSGYVHVLSGYNNTSKVGFMLRELADVLMDPEDNGYDVLKGLTGQAVRLIYDKTKGQWGKCIGIGHFKHDKFVLFKDLMEANYR